MYSLARERRPLAVIGLTIMASAILALASCSYQRPTHEASPAAAGSCALAPMARAAWQYSGSGYRAKDIIVLAQDSALLIGQTKLGALAVLLDTNGGEKQAVLREPMPRLTQAAVAAPAGGYVLVGGTLARALIVHIDDTGRVVWRVESGINHTLANGVALAGDDGYIVVGQMGYGPESRPWAAMIGTEGDLVWEKTPTAPGAYLAITSESDVVAGVSIRDGPRMAVGTIGAAGDILWPRIADVGAPAVAQAIAASGSTWLVSGPSEAGTVVARVTEDAQVLWRRLYSDIEASGVHQLLALAGGGYVLAGARADRAYAVAFSEHGCPVWRFETDEAKIARGIAALPDGDILLAGDRIDGGLWAARLRTAHVAP